MAEDCHVWVAVRMDPLHLNGLISEYASKFGAVVASNEDVPGQQERGVVVGRLHHDHGDSKGNFHSNLFFAVFIHHGPVPQGVPTGRLAETFWTEVTVDMPRAESRGTTRRKAQVPMRVLCHQELDLWNPERMTSSWSRLSTAPEQYAEVPNLHEWSLHFNNKVLVSLMCLLADMIQQEKSRYKGEFAESCVKLAAN